MTKFADLHIHTYFSDSTASPREVVEASAEFGLSCIAITDHDTVAGVVPAQEAAEEFNIEIVPGVELSTAIDDKDVHILAYFIDINKSLLVDMLEEVQKARVQRIQKMIEKLKTLGIDNIELQEVCDLVQSRSVGRPHLARVLKEKGWVSSIHQAFDKYIGDGGPAYVDKYKISPKEAIDLIKQSGGVPVLAHPMVTRKDEIIPHLVEAGLLGLEVYYPNCPAAVIKHYEGIALKHNLVVTGGSDFHGFIKENTFIGKAKVPYESVEKLKQLKS